MLLLMMGFDFCSEEDFLNLKNEQEKVLMQILGLQKQLEYIKHEITKQEFYHEPKVILTHSQLPNGSEKWMGRVKVPKSMRVHFDLGHRKYFYISFNVCSYDKYTAKSDPGLIALAKQKAQMTIKQRFQEKKDSTGIK